MDVQPLEASWLFDDVVDVGGSSERKAAGLGEEAISFKVSHVASGVRWM